MRKSRKNEPSSHSTRKATYLNEIVSSRISSSNSSRFFLSFVKVCVSESENKSEGDEGGGEGEI